MTSPQPADSTYSASYLSRCLVFDDKLFELVVPVRPSVLIRTHLLHRARLELPTLPSPAHPSPLPTQPKQTRRICTRRPTILRHGVPVRTLRSTPTRDLGLNRSTSPFSRNPSRQWKWLPKTLSGLCQAEKRRVMVVSEPRPVLRTLFAHFRLLMQAAALLDTLRSLLIWTSRVPKLVVTGELDFSLIKILLTPCSLPQIVESVSNRLIIIDPGRVRLATTVIGYHIRLATV